MERLETVVGVGLGDEEGGGLEEERCDREYSRMGVSMLGR